MVNFSSNKKLKTIAILIRDQLVNGSEQKFPNFGVIIIVSFKMIYYNENLNNFVIHHCAGDRSLSFLMIFFECQHTNEGLFGTKVYIQAICNFQSDESGSDVKLLIDFVFFYYFLSSFSLCCQFPCVFIC